MDRAALYESACNVEEFLRRVTAWKGSAEDELTEAIEDAEKLTAALEAGEDDAVALRRELLLALGEEWRSTRDLANAVGYSRYQSLDPLRTTLYELRNQGRVDLQRRPGAHGYLWRLATSPSSSSKDQSEGTEQGAEK